MRVTCWMLQEDAKLRKEGAEGMASPAKRRVSNLFWKLWRGPQPQIHSSVFARSTRSS